MHADLLNSTVAAQFVIAGIWQGLLLTSAAWLALEAAPRAAWKIAPQIARRITPGLASRIRFALWMMVFILTALVPSSTLAPRLPGAALVSPAAGILPAAHLPASWAVILTGLWALASLFALAQLLSNAFRLHRVSQSAIPLPSGPADWELRSLFVKPRSRRVRLCVSSRVDSPVAIGFFRPAIVIPQWLEQKLTPPELRQIVMHELAHLERRDDWTNLLQKVLRALFPLNPALLWAERQLCREREMACDDRVLDATASPRDYAACLASLAEKRLLRTSPTLAPGAWRRRSELAERVYRILRRKSGPEPESGRGASVVVATFLTACLCAGIGLARCPQFVTFTEAASAKNSEPASPPKSSAPAKMQRVSLELPPGRSAKADSSTALRFARNDGQIEHRPIRGARRLVSIRESQPETQIVVAVWEFSPGFPPTHSGWIIFEL